VSTVHALNPAFRDLPAADPAQGRGLGIISVASGKGGVGKTWFSITLASSLARKGMRVLLFDGDLGLANVDIQLGLFPQRDLGHYFAGAHPLRECVTPYAAGGFDILAGRSGSGNLASLPQTRFAQLVRDLYELSADYDATIVDLGAGIEAHTRGLAALSRTCVIVTNDEPTSLTDAYAFIKVLTVNRQRNDLRVVVNCTANPTQGQRIHETLSKACREFLKFEPALLGTVRRDGRVRDAIHAQTPLPVRHPGANAAVDVDGIAQRLIDGI
jgi:flagellar biosynthesis protein FlhG